MKSTNWKADTRYVHAGAHPDPSTGAIILPFFKLLPMYKRLRVSIKVLNMQGVKILRARP